MCWTMVSESWVSLPPGPESGIGEIPTSEASCPYGADRMTRVGPTRRPSELATEIEALPDVLLLRGQVDLVVRSVVMVLRPPPVSYRFVTAATPLSQAIV